MSEMSYEEFVAAEMEPGPEPAPDAPEQARPYRIWALHCPFKKDGFPSLGTSGQTIEPVIMIKLSEWNRLCNEVPQLATTQFEVGSYD